MHWLDPILSPLARLAVRKGWLFPAVERRLRQAYIAAATSGGEGAMTDSRISVMTGLQRRDIARLRREEAPEQPPRQPLAEIISRWWDDPAYDPAGLPIQGEAGSFTALARSVRQDVHPRTFLDLLIESGAVTEEAGRASLTTRSYQPLPGSEEQLGYLADNVGDHLSAAVSNVLGEAGNYDMAVHYDGLSPEAIATLEERYRAGMTRLVEELDSMVRALPQSAEGQQRFRAGGYFFKTSGPGTDQHDP
ncbi:DUF6502 family protein [Pseudoroseicyclus aestuarii]|uniref:Uncharacterized protein n=1 Tax=Pseudoroseicyclus aestuarii TaxID=1795041 RepID=A0A318T1C8_9RHOB|nr:DUF6502 family protein [Pseudoroseicyclus aestuarii]PYE85777.1 hypothetical protein DFP88_101449 [Pseudoroseicyclus aestuarii]